MRDNVGLRNYIILGFIAMCGILLIGFIATKEKNKLNKKINQQQELIEAQAQKLIDKDNSNCYCGWYEDFYYEYSEEVGAYE